MAKKKQETGKEKQKTKESRPNRLKQIFSSSNKLEITQFIIGLTLTILAVFVLLSFFSFLTSGGADQSVVENPQEVVSEGTEKVVENFTGSKGAQLSNFLINDCFGLASFFIVLLLAITGIKLMKAYRINWSKWFISCSLLLIWCSIAFAFFFGNSESFINPGGMHGYNVCVWLNKEIGSPGILLTLLLTAILFCIYLSSETINLVRKLIHPHIPLDKWKKNKPEEQLQPIEDEQENTQEKEEEEKEETSPSDEQPTVIDLDLLTTTEEQQMSQEQKDEKEDSKEKKEEENFVPTVIDMTPPAKKKEENEKTEEIEMEVNTPTDEVYEGPELEPYNPHLDLENYHYPTIDLMKKIEDSSPEVDNQELAANKNRIIEVLRNFGVEIASIKATVGPTITLYEITPAPGVRIAKIRNLENDIALSLAALGIRIIAPIPGKGTIGIEVPNARPKIVPMYSVLNSKKFQESKMELPIAIGKTISNEVFMFDLAKAPHLLVAGATGQGKSVGLNAMLTSLLYRKHPSELKFVIVDPKMVEFAIYAPIENHFLAKLPENDEAIITEVDKVVQTLQSLCIEMDDRYKLLMQANCRNIIEYNNKFIQRKLNPEKGHHFMPYIVVIIDEYGDLIMTAGKDIELPICRIAQKARAVGIHMIIATQRPTANIITGTIKANFPARIAFKVADGMNSRTIIDTTGADQLIGKGDMLYLAGNDPVRVQCAFIDTPEVENVVQHICIQQSYPNAFPLPEVPCEGGEGSGVADVDMNRLDPMFEQAARLIISSQQGSTSLIQRKLSIGYARAGRIMDQLEHAGIVGPAQGSKPRDLLCQTEMDLQRILNSLP